MTESRVKEFAKILETEQEFPSEWHIDYSDMFKGYIQVEPSKKDYNAHRTAFVRFMKDNEDFPTLTSTHTQDVLCVLKYDVKGLVSFGASLVMFECGQDLYCYIYLIKTHKEHRGEHLASNFISDIAAFATTQVKPNSYLYIAAGMSDTHRPNGFFMDRGFSEKAPEHMHDWKQKHCHCMMFRSVQHQVIARQLIEEQKNAVVAANINAPTANLKKREQKQLAKEDDGTASVAPSTMSKVTHKTSSGAVAKHCGVCSKRISGANWNKHIKTHEGTEINFVRCSGDSCQLCQGKLSYLIPHTCGGGKSHTSYLWWWEISYLILVVVGNLIPHTCGGGKSHTSYLWWWEISYLWWWEISYLWWEISYYGGKSHTMVGNLILWWESHTYSSLNIYSFYIGGNVVQQQQQQTKQSLHGIHKQQACSGCGALREARYLTNGLCAKCVKTGSKSVINAVTEPLTKPLTSTNLNVLPNDVLANEEVKEQLISKRLHDEYADYVQEDINDFMPPPPVKRIKVEQSISDYNQQNGGQEIDTVMKDTTSITDVTTPATGMAMTSLLDALDSIENSLDTDFEVSLEVSIICEQFVHQQALALLKKDSYPRLAALITKILNEQAGQLKKQQLTGLFVAACKLQGPCWTAAVIMLQRRKSDIQQYVLKIFTSQIEVTYGTDIAQWINGHWRNVQEQQLDIMKQLKGVQSPVDILFLSLAVQVDDVPKFIKHSSLMLQRDVSVYMLESICKRLTQQRLSVYQFLQLCELVQLDNVTSIIQSNADIFKSTPLYQWTTKVNELKATSHLINSESVQNAVREYIQAYGYIENEFTEDMFNEDSRLGLAMHESFNKASPKQLGLAQYCMGKIRQCQRQLWCVPSGQGKSRIIASAAAIAVETGMFSAVHISYENETLLNRDKHDFESLWMILGCVDKIHYHVGCEFPTQEGELIIVDESDTATFNTPDAFIKLINGRACICFTATPDNCDGKGVEAKVISALKLEVFHYVPDAEVVDAATRLMMDHIQHGESIDAKVSYIQSLVANGPVLVYGTVQLKEALAAAVQSLIVVDPQVDYSMLRKLDQAPYKILFADSQFGMRGIDYRCERVPMHQVIEQSFSCTRDALQGVARVGRFGDPCTRIIFDGVELVDKMKQLQQQIRLVNYAATAKVNIKQVKVKQAAPQQKNTGGKNLALRHVQAAQAQTAQQQKFMKIFTNTNK